MLIENFIEAEMSAGEAHEPSSKKAVPVTYDPNQNFISLEKSPDKAEPPTEDKTSDNYVPKSYRSQSLVNRFMTRCLALCGMTFLQPIKWKNVIQIFLLHIVCLYMVIAFPVFEIKVLTIVWGKFQSTS